jgi:hypothetical protein
MSVVTGWSPPDTSTDLIANSKDSFHMQTQVFPISEPRIFFNIVQWPDGWFAIRRFAEGFESP